MTDQIRVAVKHTVGQDTQSHNTNFNSKVVPSKWLPGCASGGAKLYRYRAGSVRRSLADCAVKGPIGNAVTIWTSSPITDP